MKYPTVKTTIKVTTWSVSIALIAGLATYAVIIASFLNDTVTREAVSDSFKVPLLQVISRRYVQMKIRDQPSLFCGHVLDGAVSGFADSYNSVSRAKQE